jgi:predicted Zn-dependent peptidase
LREEIYEEVRQKNGLVYGVSITSFGGEKGAHLIETECAPENVAKVTELIAKTCARVYNNEPLTDGWLKIYEAGCLLGEADWLDSAGKRSRDLLSEYRYTGHLYDFFGIAEMSKNITALDVQKHISGFFDMPISIITKGPDFNADLGAIWKQNFPNSNIATAENTIANQMQNSGPDR